MVKVLRRAVHDRERPLRQDLVVGFGLDATCGSTVAETERIVAEARRRFHRHNAGRRFVEAELYAALARSSRDDLSGTAVRDRLRGTVEVREALEWMWPVLTPAQLLHDLFGSLALLRHAGRGQLDDDEAAALFRARSASVDEVVWTNDDAPLLDEARAVLGPRPRARRPGGGGDDEVRTYGHIVVDEAQDLSPMQLRMLNRRSLNGSMTVVGDIAQSTGEWAHRSWQEILDHLPDRRPPRRAELTVGYRLPAPEHGAGVAGAAGGRSRSVAAAVDPRGRRSASHPAVRRRRAGGSGRGHRARRAGRGRHGQRRGDRAGVAGRPS